MDTKECLIIVCDSKDKELGIGMEEQPFLEWVRSRGYGIERKRRDTVDGKRTSGRPADCLLDEE